MSLLPSPILSSRRRSFRRDTPNPSLLNADFLFGRARITNLGVIILSALASLSFLYNLAFIFSPTPTIPNPYRTHDSLAGYEAQQSILSTINRTEEAEQLSHLIIVPGHAIWTGVWAEQTLDEDYWVLEDYQRGHSAARLSAFVSHITRGAELALGDQRSLLVFSGGQTRIGSTTTEAESYMRLALTTNVFLSASSTPSTRDEIPFSRATTENYALDSFENLLFSIARFHEYTGRYPKQITVVGYEMKRRRFTELHRAAIRWSEARFGYVGIDPVGEGGAKALEGEFQNGYMPYTVDTYGCHDYLLQKRRLRNVFARFHSYFSSSPELGGLLSWCPGGVGESMTKIYEGPLPWDILGEYIV
ncbi:hypothetical protein SERLA73DRAFT_179724 [Serpula lacrymans var. lacrymans S7.3]|uniref:DUF218 domain-containing protein n=2 Tax=Serpula lacrymans var. lacrymans TaxID=341189 RepID=F8PTZ4_SERL3|nr:uncharacterized protein SERLADRAFT_464968 [Serpula lacrymans var. lacrymans S7.9]EGN99619.1 hypothetical protein SERLA73DRAFT_179724 [Serpula lacrymans var. lacrymans S7.3]EGO25185.1 hypothetical protein SERLADRAFT_464968 [Serpula lacrymans var. lacrymans S7.9]